MCGKMKGKKGWLKIIEAVIGILMISGVLLTLNSQKVGDRDISDTVYQLETRVLADISNDPVLRNSVLSYTGNSAPDNVVSFVDQSIPNTLDFEVRVCSIIDKVCNMNQIVSGAVFVDEAFISSNLTEFSPRQIRLFVWLNE